MSIRLHTPPAAEPVTLAEAKEQTRVSGSDEDSHLNLCIAAAREYCETYQGRAYVTQTWKVMLDRFPNAGEEWRADKGFVTAEHTTDPGTILLPRAPLQYVTSIAYVDTNGTTQTLSASDYTVDTASEPGRITPAYNESYPSTREQANAVTVTFNAGSATVFTAATTDILTVTGRVFAASDVVRLYNTGGALPAGLSTATDYYVRDVSGSTFKLSLTDGGVAVDVTGTGTGTHFIGEVPAKVKLAMRLLVSHWMEQREAVVMGVVSKEVEFAVHALLFQDRIF
jgi:hypothetical protein